MELYVVPLGLDHYQHPLYLILYIQNPQVQVPPPMVALLVLVYTLGEYIHTRVMHP